MKKALAIALALVFMFALAIPAFAAVTKDASTVTISDNKAYNENLTTQSNEDPNKTVIKYEVSGNYIVTVPALITLISEDGGVHTPNVYATGTATVTADKVIVPYKQELVISMAGSGDDNAFEIAAEDGGQTIPYTVATTAISDVAASNVIVADGINTAADILVLQDGGTRTSGGYIAETSVTLTFTADELAKYHDIYQGTITFTVGLRTAQESAAP